MEHLELAIAVRPHAVEAIADLLRRYAPSGVSIETPFDAIDEEGGVAFPIDRPVRLRAWLPAGQDATEYAIDHLRSDLLDLESDIVDGLSVKSVAEADWADAWKEHFHVIRMGKRIVLKPSWREYDPEPSDIVVELDPGRAFGTGQHETTQMCLVELERRSEPGMVVLDVGSGSGILSVGAALLGAERVDAVDIDPAAVSATLQNAATNQVSDRVNVRQGSLGAAWPFDEAPSGGYDLVLANLSARIVRELSGELLGALREGGAAFVSGIVADQEESCVEALLQAGARGLERRADGDWRLLIVSQ
ncbi:MAG: 50S ribosomal protein L11 methyltransferase [Chloroflexi bacterium]|nr:50S ribosomal protein L11 methyltransferase [Chloroflexota bacterium]